MSEIVWKPTLQFTKDEQQKFLDDLYQNQKVYVELKEKNKDLSMEADKFKNVQGIADVLKRIILANANGQKDRLLEITKQKYNMVIAENRKLSAEITKLKEELASENFDTEGSETPPKPEQNAPKPEQNPPKPEQNTTRDETDDSFIDEPMPHDADENHDFLDTIKLVSPVATFVMLFVVILLYLFTSQNDVGEEFLNTHKVETPKAILQKNYLDSIVSKMETAQKKIADLEMLMKHNN